MYSVIYNDRPSAVRSVYSRHYKFPTMVSQTGHLFDILHWTYATVLEKHGMSVLQYAVLRRSTVHGTPYTHIVKATGVPRVTVWRQATDLAFRGLVRFERPEGKKSRVHVVGMTDRGYRLLRKIAAEVEKELLRVVGARKNSSARVRVFTRCLWRATWFLPRNGLWDLKSVRASRIIDDSEYVQEVQEPDPADDPPPPEDPGGSDEPPW